MKKVRGSDVIHLSFFGIFVEELLEGNFVSGFIDTGLEAAPGGAEFGGAIGVAERGRIENFAMDGAEDIAKGDFHGRAGEKIAAFLAAQAFGDAFGFEFDEDLDEIIGRNVL